MIRDFFRRLHIQSELLKEEHGQTMAEYGVVLTVITIACLAALGLLAGNVINALGRVAGLIP